MARPFSERLVLLYGPNATGPNVKSPGKQPIWANWQHRIPSAAQVDAHLARGGNVGVKAGAGLVILDFDVVVGEREMLTEFGTLAPTVETGSGKHHYYGTAPAGVDLPAKLWWKGEIVGEVQRTGAQQVVCPPSIHPTTGEPYIWLRDPRLELQVLPESWVRHLTTAAGSRRPAAVSDGELPGYIKPGDARGHEWDESGWDGPPPVEMIARALKQPGARLRSNGSVKFRCEGCAREGRDRHMDNGTCFASGRFGCAVDRTHRRAIAEQLDLISEVLG